MSLEMFTEIHTGAASRRTSCSSPEPETLQKDLFCFVFLMSRQLDGQREEAQSAQKALKKECSELQKQSKEFLESMQAKHSNIIKTYDLWHILHTI